MISCPPTAPIRWWFHALGGTKPQKPGAVQTLLTTSVRS